MFIDYEIVSTTYDIAPDRVEYMRNFLIPNGFGIFGHGHAHDNHDNHDQFDYQGAYQSFKTNFDRIKSYGFTPIAYAYPYGAGKKASTAQALKDSGFLSGRLHQVVFEGYGPCVMAGDEMEPPNWFQIPSLPMQSYEFEQDAYNYVNDAEEFFSHFEPCVEAGGWINSTYHGLGFDGTNGFPIKWGYYHFSEFEKEMLRVRELMDQGILWLAQLSEVTLYAQQRNAANVLLDKIGDNEYEIYLFDGLDRSIYTMPLTLKLELDGNFNGKRLRIVNVQAGFLQEVTINEATILLNLVPSTSPYRVRVL